MTYQTASTLPPALPAPFQGKPEAQGPHETPELKRLVDSQVKALVAAAPAAAELPEDQRQRLEDRVARIAVHAAALALDDWQITEKLGQRPLLKTKETLTPPAETAVAQSQAVSRPMRRGSGFQQDATSRVGSVTRSTLRAIAFPTFVADLIKGTFSAILDATTTQMGAFMEMLESVSKTVEQFEAENISDGQAHQWIAQQYPSHIRLDNSDGTVRAVPTDTDADVPQGIQGALNLSDSVDTIDDVTIEEVLVPAARRKLAQSRLQMLSSLVMMGLQRIVINHGRIRATMGFHIDATDSASREDASLLDTSVSAQAQVGFGMWSASASTSVTYVRSTKSDSNAELNVNADLTGEVDLTFSTDYMPLNRMATTENIARIRGNTPVPSENAPAAATGVRSAEPASSSPSAAEMINQRLEHREEVSAPDLPELDSNRFQRQQENRQQRQQQQPAASAAPAEPAPTAGGGEGTGATEAPASQPSTSQGRAA
ncbi:MAG: hypothetical protein QNJ03_13125 [Dinoroseobacter sp.]|nr:hypothetical protein [Dinoroseobacter sp.]